MNAEAYRAGDLQSGDWHWSVGTPTEAGRHIEIATINIFACAHHALDPQKVATIMAEALNNEQDRT